MKNKNDTTFCMNEWTSFYKNDKCEMVNDSVKTAKQLTEIL